MSLFKRLVGSLVLAAAALCGCGAPASSDYEVQELPIAPSPYPCPTYEHLSETGLYPTARTDVVARGVEGFEPTFKLWSDGAEKRRFIALPPGTRIDTSDMDHWQFPVGTRLWKEFSIAGVRLETRLIERHGDGPDDYWMGTFVWNADQTDAVHVEDGLSNVNGTSHDVPASGDCHTCHDGEPGRVLGFSALELADDAPSRVGIRLPDLVARDHLSSPPPATAHYAPPGDPITQAALGYLHANCGHCHNPNGYCAYPGMELRLSVDDTVAEETEVWRTVVGVPAMFPMRSTLRAMPGAPRGSAIVERMRMRGDGQMPYLATEKVDDDGVASVSAWIARIAH